MGFELTRLAAAHAGQSIYYIAQPIPADNVKQKLVILLHQRLCIAVIRRRIAREHGELFTEMI